jgi:hypothetical protein
MSGGAALTPSSGACGTTSARSFALGASTPWGPQSPRGAQAQRVQVNPDPFVGVGGIGIKLSTGDQGKHGRKVGAIAVTAAPVSQSFLRSPTVERRVAIRATNLTRLGAMPPRLLRRTRRMTAIPMPRR